MSTKLQEQQRNILDKLGHYRTSSHVDLQRLVDEVVELTDQAYAQAAPRYTSSHGEFNEGRAKMLTWLYEQAREQFPDGDINIADIGAGEGLDLQFLSKFNYTKCVAIEKSQQFIKLIPPGIEHIKADMQNLPLGDEGYHLVLHHAAIHHLPYLKGTNVGAEKSIHELYRILKKRGILSLIVKYGREMKFDEEGRFFQLFDETSMSELLDSLKFNFCKVYRKSFNDAPPGWHDWLYVFAQKKS